MGGGRSGAGRVRHFDLNSKNLKDYNLRIAKQSPSVSSQELDTALSTINQLNELLQLDKSKLPRLYLDVGDGRYQVYGRFTYKYDADEHRIILSKHMFTDKNWDTAAHEYTHALVAQVNDNILANFSARDRFDAMKESRVAKEICKDALIRLDKTYKGASDKIIKTAWEQHAGTIKLHHFDDYASSKQNETITRAVQMVLREKNGTLSVNDGRASPYAHAVVAELKNYIHQGYKIKKQATHNVSKNNEK